ncbi:WYL domain-containing protein [Streptomyces sp. I05A-00742]|uniref:WYL domain-containing protein n=1 Tax=Streptomyces sp. I05A-00742 TaxID=2732853 RepID=UPI00148887E5|nr:WYL domain-containing protein [Streptomyces sp. I05A-00742]
MASPKQQLIFIAEKLMSLARVRQGRRACPSCRSGRVRTAPCSRGGASRREAEPHGVVCFSRHSYLIAWDRGRDARPAFRVDRLMPRPPSPSTSRPSAGETSTAPVWSWRRPRRRRRTADHH